jgi:hypothetical protein
MYLEEIEELAENIAEIIEEDDPDEIDKLGHNTLVKVAMLAYELAMTIQAESD